MGLGDQLGRQATSSTLRAMALFYVGAVVLLFARPLWDGPVFWGTLTAGALALVVLGRRGTISADWPTVLLFLTPLLGSVANFAPNRPAPPPLVLLVAVLAADWLARHRQGGDRHGGTGDTYLGPLAALYVLLAASGLLTAWRYLDFTPLGGKPLLDTPVNVRNETALEALGGAWRTLVVALTGPLLFLLFRAESRPDRLVVWTRALLLGSLLAFAVGLVQVLLWPSLGNDPAWVAHGRINATFTDPNALGTYIALLLPLAAAMAVGAADKRNRALAWAVVALGLAALAGSGSRTGAAGLLVAVALFPLALALRFSCESEAFKRRVVFATAAAAIAIVSFTPVEWAGLRTSRLPLVARLAKTREAVVRQGFLEPFIRERWPLWRPALWVTLHHRVGGIGLGAFRYEVDNEARVARQQWRRRLDNANNFYLQVSSELGFAGLLVVVTVLAFVLRDGFRAIKLPDLRGEERSLCAGLWVGWVGFLLLFLTGPHTLFEQIQVVFWFYAAALTSLAARRPARPSRFFRLATRACFIAALAGLAGQVALSAGDFAPSRRRSALGLRRASGFYGWETDQTGRRYRWTRSTARLTVATRQPVIRIELRASHPDIAERPVIVWFSLDGRVVCRRDITSTDWQWVRFKVPPGTPDPADLEIRVDRTWRPSDLGLPDTRRLGVSISRIENVAEDEPLP